MEPVSIAAVGWSITMVGWVASATISRLLTKGFDYLEYDTTKKLAQLEPKILVLKRVMEVVETSPHRPRLEQLFKRLKSAFYEAEEILDAAEYHHLERRIKAGKLQPGGSSPPPIMDRMKKIRSAVAKISLPKKKARSHKGGGWTGEIPRDVRHLFVQNYDAALITAKILELENLHTLMIYTVRRDTPVEEIVLGSIVKRLPKLRVLYIGNLDTLFVPESIGQLKHLRYLAFWTDICGRILPSTLNQLYQMQLLDFGRCTNFAFSYGDLIKLRHLLSSSSDVSNISRLVSLQTLHTFTVRNEQGYEAKQLRYLNRLCGRLSIHGLKNVKSREEALEMNLAAKERLRNLSLWWYGGDTRCSPEVEAEVLVGLCPPAGLEILNILDYGGSVYPNWMVGGQNGGANKLQRLSLVNWSQPGPAPKLEAFIHLRYLSFRWCNWNALPDHMEHLSFLKRLDIYGCLNVRSLPTLPPSLEVFRLLYCNEGFMESCQTDGHPNWQKLEHIPRKIYLDLQ